ncbi:response regulator [Roseateles koreensis]|uniref:histidine kinase n=1 Tax=Roseateles koreensis TaxID=2987526 RepID=A0ABT5KUF7_9BURK|nr:response regulator [Roseateles koreensis]MDC8786559.1 response regulator [Roseateles koreensis]
MTGPSAREVAYYREAHKLLLGLATLHGLWSLYQAPATHTVALVLGLGLPALLIPAWLCWRRPEALIARMAVALSFVVFVSLAIEQSGDNPNTHLGFFVLLGALAIYCDWRPIVGAAAMILLHHALFAEHSRLLVGTALQPENHSTAAMHAFYICLHAGVLSFIAIRMKKLVAESHAVADAVLRIAAGNWALQLPDAAQQKYDTLAAVATMQEQLTQTMADLNAARVRAEEATAAKSAFLAAMSHEIRTPMNAIIGLSHLASRTEMSVQQRDYVDKIKLAGQHLLGILNDILDFSKVEAGMLSIEHTPFELDAMLQNVANVIAEKASDKGLELMFQVAQDVPPYLVGDPLRLGQVLINFANNAIKFTAQGEVSVHVTLDQSLEPTPHATYVKLKFDVKDTGIGLSPEQMSRLFREFSQAEDATARHYGGSGLGLVISKGLAALMGGDVGVDSTLGQGSTFWFTARVEVGRMTARPLLPEIQLRDRRVLVVDDNPHAAAVLVDILSSQGFAVATVNTGPLAIQAVHIADAGDQAFDIVMVDWQMPHMDGLETTRRIRELTLKHRPLQIMVTAHGREEAVRGAEYSGVDDVLLKPVNASLLFNTLIRLLSERQGASDAVQGTGAPSGPGEPAIEIPSRLRHLRGARILLVEDNDLNQQIAQELLSDAGLHVDVVENGQAALAQIEQQPYDLVLMDMQMPVMDGLEATLQLRKNPRHALLPVIAMTANALPSDRQRCLLAGMNDYVSKPIAPDELWDALARWIQPRAGLGDSANAQRVETSPTVFKSPLKFSRQAQQSVQLPDQIDGLDLALGLRRTAGRAAFYLDLLHQFTATRRTALHEVRDALNTEDRPRAERLTHSLKGLAGTLGATPLHERLRALEQTLQGQIKTAPLNEALDEAEAALNHLIQSLSLHLPDRRSHEHDVAPAASAERKPALNAVQLQALVEQIDTALARDDPEALDLLALHHTALQTAGEADFGALQAAIQQFQFDRARQILARFLRPQDLL